MTFYRAKTALCPANLLRFGLLAGLWLTTSPALAQVDLRPDQPVQTRPVQQPAPEQSAPVVAAPPASNADRGNVVTSSLAPIEPLSISLLSPANGGMGNTVWNGSSAYALTKLLTNMPGQGQSPLLNDLAARALLSGGNVPANADGKAAMQHARLQALYDLGRLNAVVELVERSPGGREDPQAAAVAVDALLALGQDKTACDLGARKGAARGGLFWRKLRAFCMAKSGNAQGAELTAGLLAEEKDVGPAFLESILAITAPVAKPDAKAKPVQVANALDLAMAEAAGKQIDPDNLPLALAVGLMNRDHDNQLALTLQAVSAGAVPIRILARQLLAVGAPPPQSQPAVTGDQPATAPDPKALEIQWLTASTKDDSLHGLAGLYWLASNSTDTPLRARAIAAILDRKGTPAERLAMARLVAPLAARIMPAQDLQDLSVDFTRLALLRNDPGMALLWFQQAQQEQVQAEDMDVALYALGGKVLVNADTLSGRLHGDDAKRTQLLRALLVADALQQEASPGLRTVLSQFDSGTTCPIGTLAALQSAARANARGEAVLRAQAISGNEPLSALPASCGNGIVHALQSAGLAKPARAFAMEWLFASQWPDE